MCLLPAARAFVRVLAPLLANSITPKSELQGKSHAGRTCCLDAWDRDLFESSAVRPQIFKQTPQVEGIFISRGHLK